MATEAIESTIDLRPDVNEDPTNKANGAGGSTSTGDELEIEVVDDTPEQDRGRPKRAPGTESSVPSDDEIGKYTKGVQDRLKQMKWEYHEERRAKEAWQREHEAAVGFARRVHEENKKLRDMVQRGHKTMLDTTTTAIESEMVALQNGLAQALETGDTAKAAQLQSQLAKAAARAEAQRHIQPVVFPEEPINQTQQPVQQQPQYQQPQQQRVQVSERMRDWMAENPWFNNPANARMTALAFGVHQELIAKQVPLESPRYFQEINQAVREAFPNYFEQEAQDNNSSNGNGRQANPRRTTVAGVPRAPAGRARPGKVTLTQSEAAVAKRLGLTEQQYAAEKLRLEQLDG